MTLGLTGSGKAGLIHSSLLQTTPLPEEAPDIAQRFTKKDVSSSLRNSESGMVDQVMVTTNVDGQRFVKVKVRPSCNSTYLFKRWLCMSPAKECQHRKNAFYKSILI